MPEFNPDMLILARESRGYTQSELAKLVGVERGTISKLEAGLLLTPDELIAKTAGVLRYPVQFFFQNEKVYGFGSSVFYHRKRKGLPMKQLRQLHAEMNIRRFSVRKLLRAAGVDTPNKFERLDPQEYRGRVEVIARTVRAALAYSARADQKLDRDA